MPYVFSKLSAHVDYVQYERAPGMDVSIPKRVVTVLGRADVASHDPLTGALTTHLGVVTKVTDEELEILKANTVFQTHEKNGFIQYSEKKTSLEDVLSGMQKKDRSAPITPSDYNNTVGLVTDDKNPEKNKVLGAIPEEVANQRARKNK